jgi:acetylornithine deacetylase
MPRLSDTELLSRLVAFDTASPNSNLSLIEFVHDYLDRPGVRLSPLPSPDGTKANLYVEVGPDPMGDRSGLLLSGHTDVVPAQEPEWASDPFQLTERDGMLFARGAADMKGFVALATNLALEIDPAALHAPLALLFTYDEEIGTLGARYFAETRPETDRLPRQAIIGEPTRLEVVHAHKGIVELRLTFIGQSAHSGYPRLGRSAIEPAAAAVSALAALRRSLEQERPSTASLFPDVPFVPLNVGTIRGGVAPNVIPDRCTVGLTIRPLPDVESGPLVERVRDTVTRAVGRAPWTLDFVCESPSMLTRPDAPLLATLLESTGRRELNTVSYATDAGWLQQLDLDCAIFGPGDIATAHRPNEHVPIADLITAKSVLERVIRRFCGG